MVCIIPKEPADKQLVFDRKLIQRLSEEMIEGFVTVSFSKGRCNRLRTCTGFGNAMQIVGPLLTVTAPHSRD